MDKLLISMCKFELELLHKIVTFFIVGIFFFNCISNDLIAKENSSTEVGEEILDSTENSNKDEYKDNAQIIDGIDDQDLNNRVETNSQIQNGESGKAVQDEESGIDEVVSKIEIEGIKKVRREILEITIVSKVGEKLSRDKIREDVKNLYGLGFFEDVIAEIERTDKGLVLIYRVVEKPVVVDLRVVGNDEINSKDILEVITVREGKIIELEKVKQSLKAIEKLYDKKGLVGTRIDYSIEPEGKGTVSLTYDIKEGKEAYIKKVEFKGNDSIKSDEIEDKIYSRPKGLFSFITKKGLYNLDEIEKDTERIRSVYIDNGFLDVNVGEPEIVYSDEEEGFIITFRIEEGNQYKISSINFSGELTGTPEELSEVISLKKGDVFSGGKLSGDITTLTTFYGNKGYAFANVDPKFSIDKENLMVSIDFFLEKGPEVFVRDIDIVGNIRTRDNVIRREIPIQEQELYNASRIQAIKSRVNRLGFFEENVEVATERIPGTDSEVNLKVKVEERPTGFFSIAGGFSSVETFILAGQIQESNLWGYGKRLSLNAQLGGVTQLFILNYQDPNLFDTDYTLDASVFRTDRRFRDFERKSWGGRLAVGRRIWKDLFSFVSYRLESVDISGVNQDAQLIISTGTQTISALGIGFTWDSRNNLLDPTKGILSRTAIEYAGGPLGGIDFIKYTLSGRFWYPLLFNHYISVLGRYGVIDFRNLGEELIVSERFFLGGPNSLRGFAFRRVGPRVPTEDGDFIIIGGVQELLFSVNYIIPIIPQVGLKGVLFFDIGNAFNDGEKLSFNPNNLRKDVGLGLRWLSPLGPLRLEVGFPIGQRLPDEDSYEIQFTIGTLF